ncbi:MAG: hypothetical protein ACWA6Y_11195 [Polaromonas sp.]
MNTNRHRASAANAAKEQGSVSNQQIEAARYVVLRRLSPALRHHMVRPLQPIGLIHSVMSHKLCEPAPDIQALRLQVEKINGFAKSALTECLDIGTWLAPEPGTLTELGAGINECIGLMATTLHFCGFRLVNEVDVSPVSVDRDALRMVLIAVMFEMTDALSVPATLTLSASLGRGEASLLLRFSPLNEGRVERYDDGYRNVTWDDVQTLAVAGDVRLSRLGNGIAMHFAVRSDVERVH